MRIGTSLLALLVLWSGHAAAWTTETRASGLQVATTPATATWGDRTLPATFSVECYPGDDGAFTLMLVVNGVEAFADFPYLDFEGPDAPMNARDLFRIAAGDNPALTVSQGGWFTTGTDFAFAHADIPAGDGPVRAVVIAVLAGASPLAVSIVHPDDPSKAIIAEIPLDGALPALATATEGCLG